MFESLRSEAALYRGLESHCHLGNSGVVKVSQSMVVDVSFYV